MLPTENEWEAAASGFAGREYPWGNEWEDNRCNSAESGIGKTSPVGIFPMGGTPERISDLAGNVWEWQCSDYHSGKEKKDFVFDKEITVLLEEYYKTRCKDIVDQLISIFNEKGRQLPVLRGGSWSNKRDDIRCAFRFGFGPDVRFIYIGFRCLRKNM